MRMREPLQGLPIPFSQTYPSMDRPCSALGSCFTAAGFTRGLRLVPALTAPQAFRLSEELPASLHQIDRRIQIPVQHQPALLAVKDPI